jgi:hypothetical protein
MIRRIALLTLTIVVVAASIVAIIHRREGHDVTPKVVAQQAVAKTASQPDLPQAQPPKISLDTPQPTTISPEEESAFASLAEADVSQLHEGITLAQWMDLHGKNESWEKSTDEAYFDCRAFVKTETLPSGRQITRMVYFYPPEAPTPAVFPTLGGQELINRTCELALVRVQTRTSTRQDGRALAQAVQQQFAKKYGDSIGMKGVGFRGSGAWDDAARWMATSEIVSAYNPTKAADMSDDPSADSVFVFARLPIVYKIERNACCAMKDYRYRSIENTQFHRAIEIVGVDATLSKRIVKLYEDLFRNTAFPELADQPELEKSRVAVLPVLRDWLRAVKRLPPTRRAAGLYAADQLLSTASENGWLDLIDKEKTDLRSALQAIGASFEYDELGGCYVYSNNWLGEARKLDPDGVMGQMAVLVTLARGGTGIIAIGGDFFRTVIVEGEHLLARNLDAATTAQLHFIVGDAYSDIVALAGGAEPDYDDPAKYKDEADSAHTKALEHYRAGLAVDGISENAKDAWLQAWHLSAGLLPTTRYVYIYD